MNDSTEATWAQAAAFSRENMGSQVDSIVLHLNDTEIAGVLVVDGELTALRTNSEFQGFGIASAIIRVAKSRHRRLSLTCSGELVRFYRDNGFFVAGPQPPGAFRMEWCPGDAPTQEPNQ